ncbi:MAG: hypothetical protein DI548_06075 [Flavobacterium johnsoniae]|nr:MAG: hypothetical protein DI548_06075 [Flavobacterium johnsoniae]
MAHFFLLTNRKRNTAITTKKIVMKKILVLAALILSFGVNAAASDKAINEISVTQEKQYKPIEPSAIPADVLKTISSKYGGYTIKEAHVASDGEYKLVLSKDDKTVTAYFTATGEFIKEA